MGTVHLLVSPNGGRGRARAAMNTVCSVIERAGHAVVDVSGSTAAASREAAHAAVSNGAARLVAVGGDGIIHIATQAVAGTDTVLGIVPAGTGNDFARALGLLEASVDQAAARALGPARPVDAIGSDQAWVASSVTGGFSVTVNNRAERMRFPRGSSRYTLASLLAVAGLRHDQLVFTVDGKHHKYTTSLWAVANTPTFGGGMAICPDADFCDGQLDLTVVGDMGRSTLLSQLPKAFKGTHVKHPKVHTLRGRVITVALAASDSDTDGAVAANRSSTADNLDSATTSSAVPTIGSAVHELRGDGELIGSAPITLTAVPAALYVAAD